MEPRSKKHVVAGLLCFATSLVLFQNCTPAVPNVPLTGLTAAITSSNGGATGGADGLRYQTYATCPNGSVGVESIIDVSSDYQTASLERQGCQDLASPMPVTAANLSFVQGNRNLLVYNVKVYDLQTLSQTTQPITTNICYGKDETAWVWVYASDVNTYWGSVDLSTGATTGPLQLQTPSGGDYKSISSSTNQMDLNITSSVLTFFISSTGDQESESVSGCVSQPLPVPNTSTPTPTPTPTSTGTQQHHSGHWWWH